MGGGDGERGDSAASLVSLVGKALAPASDERSQASADENHGLLRGITRLEMMMKDAFVVLEIAVANEESQLLLVSSSPPARPRLQKRGSHHASARILQRGDTFVEKINSARIIQRAGDVVDTNGDGPGHVDVLGIVTANEEAPRSPPKILQRGETFVEKRKSARILQHAEPSFVDEAGDGPGRASVIQIMESDDSTAAGQRVSLYSMSDTLPFVPDHLSAIDQLIKRATVLMAGEAQQAGQTSGSNSKQVSRRSSARGAIETKAALGVYGAGKDIQVCAAPPLGCSRIAATFQPAVLLHV